MSEFDFSIENNKSESDLFENLNNNRKFRSLAPDSYVALSFSIITGEKLNTKLLYTKQDKQLFTFNAIGGTHGRTYRCQNRQCKARVLLLPSGQCVQIEDTQKS